MSINRVFGSFVVEGQGWAPIGLLGYCTFLITFSHWWLPRREGRNLSVWLWVGRKHCLLFSCFIPRHMALHLGTGQHHILKSSLPHVLTRQFGYPSSWATSSAEPSGNMLTKWKDVWFIDPLSLFLSAGNVGDLLRAPGPQEPFGPLFSTSKCPHSFLS